MGNPIDETLAHEGATTLDECLKRAPSLITDADLDAIIAASRAERAQFEIKSRRKDEGEAGEVGREPGGTDDGMEGA